MKRVFIIPVFTIFFAIAFSGCLTPAPKPEPQQQEKTPSADVIDMYEQIITLRQRIYRDTEIKTEAGNANLLDLAQARENLANAKINLAELRNRDDIILEELQNLVQFYIKTKAQMVQELDAGQGLARDLYELEISLMEANIRLSNIVQIIKPLGSHIE